MLISSLLQKIYCQVELKKETMLFRLYQKTKYTIALTAQNIEQSHNFVSLVLVDKTEVLQWPVKGMISFTFR